MGSSPTTQPRGTSTTAVRVYNGAFVSLLAMEHPLGCVTLARTFMLSLPLNSTLQTNTLVHRLALLR